MSVIVGKLHEFGLEKDGPPRIAWQKGKIRVVIVAGELLDRATGGPAAAGVLEFNRGPDAMGLDIWSRIEPYTGRLAKIEALLEELILVLAAEGKIVEP